MCKFRQLDIERLRINHEYKTTSKKISVSEKLALEQIKVQKLVLKKSLNAATKELASLNVSRESMITAIGKFSENIMAKKSSKAERECAFKLIGLLSHELEQLRSDSELKFKLMNDSVMKALQNPFTSKMLGVGEDKCIF
jgi:hypothetical protein